jgi:hypothetical protein
VAEPAAALTSPSPGLDEVIVRRVAERAPHWFPDVGAAPAVRLQRLAERPRALLYAVQVGPTETPRVLAKVRRDWPQSTRSRPDGARPRLTSDFLPAAEQTALEYRGLTAIRDMVGPADPAFAAVRPLDHLVAEHTVLLEYVAAGTLRNAMVRDSRLSPRRWRGDRRLPQEAWRRAGEWLRRYQQHMPHDGLPVRQRHRDDVVALFSAYGEFLERRIGGRTVAETARRGAELAADVLPEELPLAVGHGDFAPRNVFLLSDGRLAVFDPLPRWLVPRFDDLCRFLVGVRLNGLTLNTHGWSEGTRELDRRERDLIEGYGGDEPLPMRQVRCYQLLITLDKWSTLVDAPARSRGRLRSGLQEVSTRMSLRYLRGEVRRLLDLAENAPQ